MKQVIEFIVRVEINENGVDVQILDADIEDIAPTPTYEGPLDQTVDNVEYISTITYHGSEEEWYMTYKE